MIYGIHPLQEALNSNRRRVDRVVIEDGKPGPRIQELLRQCRDRNIPVERLPRPAFRKKFGSVNHQGIVAYLGRQAPVALESLIEISFENDPCPTLALFDGIQDPQNLGALIRSASGFGLQGVIVPKDRSAPLNETVAKCSSGALELLPVAQVINVARSLEILKEAGYWVAGLSPDGDKPCFEFKFDAPTVLVIGGEGKGIRPLVLKACDFQVQIPMAGTLGSLNASAAGAVLFYECYKQKLKGKES